MEVNRSAKQGHSLRVLVSVAAFAALALFAAPVVRGQGCGSAPGEGWRTRCTGYPYNCRGLFLLADCEPDPEGSGDGCEVACNIPCCNNLYCSAQSGGCTESL